MKNNNAMKKGFFKIVLLLLIMTYCFPVMAAGKAKVYLSAKSISLNSRDKKTITLTNSQGKVTWKLDKKGIVDLSKTTGKTVSITAKKAGTVVLSATCKKKKYNCKITVKERKTEETKNGRIPIYTGVDRTDYLADIYLKRAGVNDAMSDEEIVQRIYIFLTKKWRYPYEQAGNTNKPIDLKASEKKINRYKKAADKLKKEKKIRYNDKYAIEKWESFTDENETINVDMLSYPMSCLVGVCDYNSATFTVMCNHAGVVAGKVNGTIGGNGHAWSWAKINGQKYYYDIGNSIHHYYSDKTVEYYWYKLTKSEMIQRGYVFMREW